MKQYTQEEDFCTEKSETWSELEQVARKGACKMLEQACKFQPKSTPYFTPKVHHYL